MASNKTCIVCSTTNSKYKCPKCLGNYCSSQCCKIHTKTGCVPSMASNANSSDVQLDTAVAQMRFLSADTVSEEKLRLLEKDKTVQDLLSNPHLKQLLISINNSKTPDRSMQIVMQDPLFVEFADACLKIVQS